MEKFSLFSYSSLHSLPCFSSIVSLRIYSVHRILSSQENVILGGDFFISDGIQIGSARREKRRFAGSEFMAVLL